MVDSGNKPMVVVEKSNGYYEGTLKALKLLEDQIAAGAKDKKKILIKPNFVSTSVQLAATHVDTVKAILDLSSKYFEGEVMLGEGPALGSLDDAMTNFGYNELLDEFSLKPVDLNKDKWIEIEGVDRNLKPKIFHVSRTLLESDYLISVAKPKTHDNVITTLSIKNVVVGSLVSTREKEEIHQGTKAININIARLGKHCMPDLAVIDGFVGMEGDGPTNGTPVALGVSSASEYPVSLDAVMSKIMGFEPLDIGYLNHLNEWGVGLAELDKVKVVGKRIDEVSRKFKPHSTYKEQLLWQ